MMKVEDTAVCALAEVRLLGEGDNLWLGPQGKGQGSWG